MEVKPISIRLQRSQSSHHSNVSHILIHRLALSTAQSLWKLNQVPSPSSGLNKGQIVKI
jgi:hypothetical protein